MLHIEQTTPVYQSLKPRNYRSYRNGNFCKGTRLAKLLQKLKSTPPHAVSLKKSTGFSRTCVTASLLFLGALLRDNLEMGAFS